VSRVSQGRAPIIHGDGSQTRDFVHVDDVIAVLLAAGAIQGEPQGEAINIGSGRAVSVLELAKTVRRLAGRDDLPPTHDAARPGDVPHSCADVSRAAETLGFSAEVDLERGLGELLAMSRDNHQAPVV